MTTSVLDRVPVDDIAAQVHDARPGRVALTVVAGFFFCLGWVAAKVFAVAFLAGAWAFVAVREGWRASHGPSKTAQLAKLQAENEQLKTIASRFS